MAQINVTLDQDEILRLLADSSGDALRQVLAAALVTTMAEMGGVSTAKVGKAMREICGGEFSKQSVSTACATLDSAVEGFMCFVNKI